MKQLTLAYLITDDQICLAYKKRGFGEGLFNGYGGKLEENETHEQAACREIHEESGVQVAESDLEKVATHRFIYIQEGELEVHVYLVKSWQGQPKETEEMSPQWYALTEIPYGQMWEADQHWLPRVLAGERVRGKSWFGETGRDLLKIELEIE